MLLVLNKYDLVEELAANCELEEFMTYEYLQKFAEDYGFIGAVCTSAKTGVGVTEAVSSLVRQTLIRELSPEDINNLSVDKKGPGFKITRSESFAADQRKRKDKKKKCC